MSATINIDLFKDYFDGEAPVIQVIYFIFIFMTKYDNKNHQIEANRVKIVWIKCIFMREKMRGKLFKSCDVNLGAWTIVSDFSWIPPYSMYRGQWQA